MIMMLRAIDLKSEHLNPILDLQNEQHSSVQQMYNFTCVMFLRMQLDLTDGIHLVVVNRCQY